MRTSLLLLLPVMTVLTATAQKNYSALLDSFMTAEAQVHQFNGNVLLAKGISSTDIRTARTTWSCSLNPPPNFSPREKGTSNSNSN